MTLLTNAILPSIDVTNKSQREKKPRVDFAEWADDAADVGLTNELERYRAAHFKLDDCDEDRLLEFWERQAPTFPRLRALARRILCVPASSAASERTFSSAGRVIEARRNRLNPGTVDSILFLHSARKAKNK